MRGDDPNDPYESTAEQKSVVNGTLCRSSSGKQVGHLYYGIAEWRGGVETLIDGSGQDSANR
jgi:hypothetical protein